MGSINYGTSDILTIGVNTNDIESYGEWELESLHDDIRNILEDYTFYHHNVKIECGYYEGFYISIEYQDYSYLDDYQEKLEVLKELSDIHRLLKECIRCGLVSCYPGWCTGYSNEKESIQELKKAISEAKENIRTTPTERNYYRKAA